MSRIGPAFDRLKGEGRLGLIAYLTVGYPSLAATPDLVEAVANAGADLIELGIPFSDPLADGRTIQASSQAALRGGSGVKAALDVARKSRGRTSVPLLFMTYVNPVLAFGLEHFCRAAAEAGIDGLIVPDVPPEEAGQLRSSAQQSGLDVVFLVAPTSGETRIQAACAASSGFVYCIAVTGITGARNSLDPAVLPLIARVRQHTDLPVVVGFGLSRSEHLQALKGKADGAIIASALLDAIGKSPDQAVAAAARFIRELRR